MLNIVCFSGLPFQKKIELTINILLILNLLSNEKVYSYLLFCSSFLFSCTKNEQPVNEQLQNVVILKSAGDLQYDVLGQGYDITGAKDDYKSVRLPVINIAKFKAAQPARLILDFPVSANYTSTFAVNSKEYSTKISVNTMTSATAEPFSESITNNFSEKSSYSSLYSFASIDHEVTRARAYLNADNSMLLNYLSDSFIDDLQTKSGNVLVQMYGTHVLKDIKTGGRFHLIYRSIIKESNKEDIVKAGAIEAIEKLTSWSTLVQYDNTLTTKNTEAFGYYTSTGGTTSFIGSVDLSTGITALNVGGWATSVHSEILGSAVFLSTDYSTVIPIYELVSNATKKAELKLAVENYINSKKLDMRSPFYRNYHSSSKGHLYTTDFFELSEAQGWTYEGVEGYLYNYNAPGTVRLYRYYHSGVKDHFYTLNPSSPGSSWTYESSFIYYVYKNQVSGTVPLYRYYSSSNRHHFYTTNYSELGNGANGYSLEKIECYIFPN